MADYSKQPLTTLITNVNDELAKGTQGVSQLLAEQITPLAGVCFGIYIILVCIRYLRGEESEPVFDFGLKMVGLAIVLGLGLNANNYVNFVLPILRDISGDLAKGWSGDQANASNLDQLALHYLRTLTEGFDSANVANPPYNTGPLMLYLVKALCVMFGLVPYLALATFYMLMATVGIQMVGLLGPVFFAFLLFPVTRNYFSAWLNSALQYALMPLVVAVIAGISIKISMQLLNVQSSLDSASSGGDVTFYGIFIATLCNLVLFFLLRQISTLLSGLSMSGSTGFMAHRPNPGSEHTVSRVASHSHSHSHSVSNVHSTAPGAERGDYSNDPVRRAG